MKYKVEYYHLDNALNDTHNKSYIFDDKESLLDAVCKWYQLADDERKWLSNALDYYGGYYDFCDDHNKAVDIAPLDRDKYKKKHRTEYTKIKVTI